jgi:hypothetical protein
MTDAEPKHAGEYHSLCFGLVWSHEKMPLQKQNKPNNKRNKNLDWL